MSILQFPLFSLAAPTECVHGKEELQFLNLWDVPLGVSCAIALTKRKPGSLILR